MFLFVLNSFFLYIFICFYSSNHVFIIINMKHRNITILLMISKVNLYFCICIALLKCCYEISLDGLYSHFKLHLIKVECEQTIFLLLITFPS